MNFCKYGCGNIGIKQLKSGEWICSESHNKCPIRRKENSMGSRLRTDYKIKVACQFCNKKITKHQVKIHERTCYLNPLNLKKCYCGSPIKDYKNAKTCSNACANKKFKRIGEQHWNYQNGGNDYRSICFSYHERKCCVCNEKLVVAVHHYDEDSSNNDPKNLIPICPTHHGYAHSKYYYIVKECIDDYYNAFSL